MRARYYNQDIKRFINRDVVSGDITNSQSLNRYCYVQGNPVSLIDPFGLCPTPEEVLKDRIVKAISNTTHWLLDAVGFVGGIIVPGFGDLCDAINAGIYVAEEEYGMAAVSIVCAIPFVGTLLSIPAKYVMKHADELGAVALKYMYKNHPEVATNISEWLIKKSPELYEKIAGLLSKKGDKIISYSDYSRIYQDSIHNSGRNQVMLGKYDNGGATSYITRAGNEYTYFSLGDDWNAIKAKYGYTDDEMFKLFNEAFLDDGINEGKIFQFSHNPINDKGALWKEYQYLLKNGYIWDDKTMTMIPTK